MVLIRKSKVAGASIDPCQSCMSCIYCWNDKINKMRKWDLLMFGVDVDCSELSKQVRNGKVPTPYPEEECQFYYVEGHWLQYSAKSEGFHEVMFGEQKVILQTLGIVGLGKHLRILSKRDYRMYLDDVPKGAYCGVSFTTWNRDISKKFEWGAATPGMRLAVLNEASRRGFETWISAEPMLEGSDLAKFVRRFPKTRQVFAGILTGARNKEHPDLGLVEIPGLKKPEIISQFREAVQEAKENAPHMQLFLKNQMGSGKAGEGLKITKRIWNEEGYFPTSIPKCSPAMGVYQHE